MLATISGVHSVTFYTRCIKSNTKKLPQQFDDEFVLKQLRFGMLGFRNKQTELSYASHILLSYTGMLEAVRVRKEGFSYRPFFSDFVSDYKSIAFKFTDRVSESSLY